jgi:16S rRNA (cytosine967-C5)-methyltransferase
MRDLVDRLGLTNVRVECVDVLASSQGGVAGGQHFDRILLDVPCSNMGVIARRPESVYRITPESIKELAELQYNILTAASTNLASGGILVYATCSPDPEETTKVINRFVKEHPEFEKSGNPVFPGAADSRFDGFFAQALRRK